MLGSVRVNSVRVKMADLDGSDCHVLYDYWRDLRADRLAPTWREFDLSPLPANSIRFTHVVDVHPDPFDITFRFWGTGLTEILYFDRTGGSLLTTNMGYLSEDRRQQVLADYRVVIETRAPLPFLWDASSTREHAARLIVPSLRLPLSADGETVTQIVTHFDFAAHPAAWRRMFEVEERRRRE